MTKSYRLTLIFLFLSLVSYGQQPQKLNNHIDSRNPKWLLDITAGANIDLIYPGVAPGSELFDSKPKVVPMTGFRLTYLFSDIIGGYARVQLNLYKTKKSTYNPSGIVSIIEDIIQRLVEVYMPAVPKIHSALDVGIIGRFEQDKWSIHPGIGLGYMTYLPNRESSRSFKQDGIIYTESYSQRASFHFLNFGLSTRYLLFDGGALLLDINFQQPLQKSFAELSVCADHLIKREFYQTSTAGRNLNISIGYSFLF